MLLLKTMQHILFIKNLLKQELSPINAKLDGLTSKLSDIDTAVNFLSGKYDALLNELKDTNRKVNSHASDGKQSLSYMAIDIWKDLPSSLKDLSVFVFPKYIKRYLLSEQKLNQFFT